MVWYEKDNHRTVIKKQNRETYGVLSLYLKKLTEGLYRVPISRQPFPELFFLLKYQYNGIPIIVTSNPNTELMKTVFPAI